MLKLAKDRPAWTLQAQPGPATGPFHWDNRLLSTLELCRLQTFPADVRIHGNRGSTVRQIGNAVPSLMAEILARALLEQAFEIAPLSGAPALLPSRKGPPPPPTQPAAVPDAMLCLRGNHTAHPGTGRGYGRQALRAA